MITGISIMIMLAGTLLPVLAAAPFYLQDYRAKRHPQPVLPDQEL